MWIPYPISRLLLKWRDWKNINAAEVFSTGQKEKSMRDIGIRTVPQGLVDSYIPMDTVMKAKFQTASHLVQGCTQEATANSGLWEVSAIQRMGLSWNNGKMDLVTRECIKMDRGTVLESISGLMEVRMKMDLKIVYMMATESTDLKAEVMLVTGRKLVCMVKDILPGNMADISRESTSKIKKWAMEFLHGQMDLSTQDFGKTESSMGWVVKVTKKEISRKENGSMVNLFERLTININQSYPY